MYAAIGEDMAMAICNNNINPGREAGLLDIILKVDKPTAKFWLIKKKIQKILQYVIKKKQSIQQKHANLQVGQRLKMWFVFIMKGWHAQLKYPRDCSRECPSDFKVDDRNKSW